jgi:methyl-accepting chemotaxis protein
MNWLEDRKLAAKLIAAFGALIVTTALLGAVAIRALSDVNDVAKDLETNWMPSVTHLSDINTATSDVRIAELQLAYDTENKDRHERELTRELARIAEDERIYVPLIASEEERGHWLSFKRQWERYLEDHERVVASARANRDADAKAILKSNERLFESLSNELIASVQVNVRGGNAASARGDDVYAGARRSIFLFFLVAFVGGVFLASFIARTVADPANRMAHEISELVAAAKDGQLDARGDPSKFQGTFHRLIVGMNELLVVLVTPMNAIVQVAPVLASSSQELTAVSQQLGASAEETSTQASTVAAASEEVSRIVETVSSASEEMISSIKEISRNASHATQVAGAAMKTAETTNHTITKLGESSSQIGKVIKVITSIAQQTNLLALNATIEAARAGEAGKGFAVVANEDKELAKETAKATEEISAKIESIQLDAREAAVALEQITQVITQIHSMQSSVATAVEEQTATTNEIGRSVAEAARSSAEIARNIRGVADAGVATATGATEIQRTAKEHAKMADDLMKIIAPFKFGEVVHAIAPRSAYRIATRNVA